MTELESQQKQQSEVYHTKDTFTSQKQIANNKHQNDTLINFQLDNFHMPDKNNQIQVLNIKSINSEEYRSKDRKKSNSISPSDNVQFLKMGRINDINNLTLQNQVSQIEQNGNNVQIVTESNSNNKIIQSNTKIQEKQNGMQSRSLSFKRRCSTKTGSKISDANILEDEYFGEDSIKKQNERQKLVNPDYFYKLRDHQTQWNNKVFFEIIFYHIVFYFFLGPFINLLFFSKRALMRNMSFWGNKTFFYIQTLIYTLNIITFILFNATHSPNIYKIDIIYMEVTIFLRIFIISCKYATLPSEKIYLYKNFVLSNSLTSNDYYFDKWVKQDPSTVYRETYNALQRGEYDPQMFYMGFFVNPSNEKMKYMDSCIEELQKYHKYDDQFKPPCTYQSINGNTLFYGYSIVSLFVQQFKETNKTKNIFLFCVILAIIRGIATLIYRFIAGEHYQFEQNEIIQVIGIMFNTTFGYFSSFIFLAYFIHDLKMKYFLLEQCKLMLQYRKTNRETNKLLPTIDFTNPYSLKGWSILRRVLLDYGKAFFIRLQVFLSMYIIVGAVGLVIMILQIYNVINVDGDVVVVCVFEVFVILAASLYMLYRGALINETFPEFKNTLIDYKVLIADLILLKNIYFSDEDIQIHNLLRRRSVEQLNLIFDQIDERDDKQEFIQNYLDQIEYSIEECEKELEQDELNQPFRLFKLNITQTQFLSLLVGLGTIAATLVQQIIVGYQEKYG